jgi:hypothetical protein
LDGQAVDEIKLINHLTKTFVRETPDQEADADVENHQGLEEEFRGRTESLYCLRFPPIQITRNSSGTIIH